MICINVTSVDPHFNLATEEYLLKEFADDILLIWQNAPSVVVGKHQNMMAEVSYPYLLDSKIPVVRRLSGGGTVVHDAGNVNFTIIATGTSSRVVDFRRFITPIIDFLNFRGVPATLSSRNDILVDGMKVSGNAEHVYKNRVLHHGTLLFSSDLNRLRSSIASTGASYTDSAVKSHGSRVTNMQPYFATEYTVQDFRNDLFRFLQKRFAGQEYALTSSDAGSISTLRDAKYCTWGWNFGYSPTYSFESSAQHPLGIKLQVQKGIIADARLYSRTEHADELTLHNLVGIPHDSYSELENVVKACYGNILDEGIELKSILY